jgi:transposase
MVASPLKGEVSAMILKEVFMEIHALLRRGYSQRQIAQNLGIHRNTVKHHLNREAFPEYRKKKRSESILDPYRRTIRDYLDEEDYRATWIFDQLKRMGYAGSYDTLKRYVHVLKEQKVRVAYARFETAPGFQAQCDWGDFQVQEADGSVITVYAFVLVLGYSRALYVQFVRRCTLEAFLDCHIGAFHYLKGVPAEVLYDRMKNVIIGRDQGRPVFNLELLHFARHYGFQPRPCPPYSPWVKGKAERPIDYLRERFWRGYIFCSLEKTNEDVRTWLDETANQRTHGTHHRPVAERWQEEIPALGPLPTKDYDTSLRLFRKVYRDCQLSYNGNRYVVPHRVVGRQVLLKVKNGLIRIYDNQDLLATYEEPATKNNLVANPLFYEELRQDQEQLRRKYGRVKGRAQTRGLVNARLGVDVHYRPLADYEPYALGGVSWNS